MNRQDPDKRPRPSESGDAGARAARLFAVGVFVSASAVTLLGAVAFRSVQRVGSDYRAVAEEAIPLVGLLDDVRHHGMRAMASAVEFSIFAHGAAEHASAAGGNHARHHAEHELEEVEESIENLAQALARYERMSRQDRALITAVGEAALQVQAAVATVVETGDKDDDFLVSFREELEGAEHLFLAAIQAALASEVGVMRTAHAKLAAESTATARQMVWAALAAAALTLAVGRFIIRRSNRIHELASRLTHDVEVSQAKARAKSAFLASMSHELRTPLNGVLGATSLLEDSELTEEQRDLVSTANNAGRALLSLINDVLDLSKIEAGRLKLTHKRFDLRGVVEDTIQIVAETAFAKQIELISDFGEDVPRMVVGDRLRLGQILINLVGNAAKFTDSGEVVARVRRLEGNSVSVRLRVSIEDTGVGIAEDQRTRLFESFEQGQQGDFGAGTGLGLAIAKQLTELMGGVIGCDSEVGRGSTFWVELNLGVDESPAAAEVLPAEERRVLVAIWNTTLRHVVARTLAQWGASVQEVSSLHHAAAVLAQSRELGRPHDLVIFDVAAGIGGGVAPNQGVEASWAEPMRLEFERPGCAYILMSPPATRSAHQVPVPREIVRTLIKPVRLSALERVIRAVFGESRVAAVSAGAERRAAPEPVGRATIRILVVDDNVVNRKVSSKLVERLGYGVDVACDGRAAVAAAQETVYGAILMDCRMPIMDGYEATMAIRRSSGANQHTPIIALTANTYESDRQAAFQSGMDDFLSKPVSRDDLTQMLLRWAKEAPAVAGAGSE